MTTDPKPMSPAAAKAEAADPVVGRWYFVTTDGAATLCVDEADARESASDADIAFPRMAPHQVTQLVSASQLAAAVAAERERCIGIIESHHIPVGNSATGEMACEWTYDALKTIRAAIRAGAKEPSDADKTGEPPCGQQLRHLQSEAEPPGAYSMKHSDRRLWESIYGPGTWEANPWVSAASFRRLDAKEGTP